jgi:hypothetical protein
VGTPISTDPKTIHLKSTHIGFAAEAAVDAKRRKNDMVTKRRMAKHKNSAQVQRDTGKSRACEDMTHSQNFPFRRCGLGSGRMSCSDSLRMDLSRVDYAGRIYTNDELFQWPRPQFWGSVRGSAECRVRNGSLNRELIALRRLIVAEMTECRTKEILSRSMSHASSSMQRERPRPRVLIT